LFEVAVFAPFIQELLKGAFHSPVEVETIMTVIYTLNQ
jgi:hypothetical protein